MNMAALLKAVVPEVLIPPSTPELRRQRDGTTRCWQALLRAVLRGPAKEVFKLSKVRLRGS
jgi:hypothetical protein